MDYLIERREEEKERRREEILDAAEAVFELKGFDSATMDQVARQARVSRALVYVYFKDKESLHLNICLRGLRILKERFRMARLSQARGADQVRAIGHAYMQFAADFPTRFSAMSRFEAKLEGLEHTCESHFELMQTGRSVHEETVLALLQGMGDESLRKDLDNPMQISITLWAFTHGTIQLAHSKELFIQSLGISKQRFMEDAVNLAMKSLEAP